MMDVVCPTRGSKPWWDRFRVALSLAALLTICSVGTGCYTSLDDKHEDPLTPLDCDKSRGQYYDPTVARCITVGNSEQAYVLSRYRRMVQLAQDTPDAEVDFTILFKDELTAEQLHRELADAENTIVYARLRFPQYKNFTLSGEFAAPVHVDQIPVALLSSPSLTPLTTRLTSIFTDLEAELTAGRFTTWAVRLRRKPGDMLHWWDSHWSTIRTLQPRVDSLDRAQFEYCPSCPIP